MVRKLDPKLTRLRSKTETDILFTAYDLALIREQQIRKDEHQFTGRFSPSKLEFGMCPHTHIRKDLQTYTMADSKGGERMDIGKALHEMVLKRLLETEIVYTDVVYPEEMLAANTRKNWTKIREKVWPSFPVFSPNGLWSGEIDVVLVIKGQPTIIDLKFPQAKDLTRWRQVVQKFPGDGYETQVCVYAELCNRYGFTKDKIRRVGVAARNYFVEAKGDKDSVEVYFDYSGEREEKTISLMDALEEEMARFDAGVDEGCTYRGCSKHADSSVR